MIGRGPVKYIPDATLEAATEMSDGRWLSDGMTGRAAEM